METLQRDADLIRDLSQLYIEHKFDLLGSGWTHVRHGSACRGFEGNLYPAAETFEPGSGGHWLSKCINPSNVRDSQNIWSLLPVDYESIDWHLDFISGYRWSDHAWYGDVPYGHLPGVDIKVPWELARMQHLPQLAWAYALAKRDHSGFRAASTYLGEFRNQILDFVASNPPRFGVNWRSPMEVAIRAANWLVAYDLFRAAGAELDLQFEIQLQRSLYQHGEHLVNNLEWNEGIRANHYLANIVGLAFIAAYMPCSPETDTWLAFSIQELKNEVSYQFFPEGSNFESSTSYHRFAAEMITYATAVLCSLNNEKLASLSDFEIRNFAGGDRLQPAPLPMYEIDGCDAGCPFPEEYFRKVGRMAEFTVDVTKPNGQVVQIGDNDSGRFLKLSAMYRRLAVDEAKSRYLNLKNYEAPPGMVTYLDEEILDHRHLVAAINGLFQRRDFALFAGGDDLETELVSSIYSRSHDRSFSNKPSFASLGIGTEDLTGWEQLRLYQESVPPSQRQELKITVPGDRLLDGLHLCRYPDFGIYIYASRRMYLAIRCGQIGRDGYAGHAHNDQLALELNIDGEDWVADPGTFIYTPIPELRNQYRSAAAHFVPRLIEGEPWSIRRGLFRLTGKSQAECLHFSTIGFVGALRSSGVEIIRSVILGEGSITLVDTASHKPRHEIADLSLTDVRKPAFSNAYGKRLAGGPDTVAPVLHQSELPVTDGDEI